jgi:hypothetical protein
LSAVRVLEEKVTLSRQIAQRITDSGRLSAAAKYQDHGDDLDKEVSIIRKLISTVLELSATLLSMMMTRVVNELRRELERTN